MRTLLRPAAGLLRSALGTNGVAARLASIEARLGRLTAPVPAPERVPEPEPEPEPEREPAVAPAPPIDTNLLLHQSRGALLRELPRGARRLVSAGCAGAWYFDWIAQCYGPVPEHVGIEYYMPRPDHLPPNVTWIENTASDMAGLADASCDLMISGQNIEHLWADEVAGFLMEAARVIRPGGTLAVDSPNRAITAALTWSHPEHTIELTAAEMRHLLGLAGFTVTKAAGMWLCRDPWTGRLLPYDAAPEADWSVAERLIVARDHVAESFLWWLEGARTAAVPDRAAIDAYLAGLYAHAWPERLGRMQVPAGQATEARADGPWVLAAPGQDACVLFGPYVPLRAGRYTASFAVEATVAGGGVCEVVAAGRVLAQAPIPAGRSVVALAFALPALQFGMEFRCLSRGGGFAVRRAVHLT